MSEKKRKNFSSQFKAKVALEAIRGVKTVTEIAQAFGVHPTQVTQLLALAFFRIKALNRLREVI